MVKILPSGELVDDNDPRTSQGQSNTDRGGPRQRRGQIQNDNQDPVAHMPQASIFDNLNQKLIDAGIPRWNLGSHVIEPIVSVGFLLALLVFGLPGIIFGGLLFIVSKWSQGGSQGVNSSSGGHGYRPRQAPSSDDQGQGGSSSGRTSQGHSWGGGGNKLGKS